ncbi:MAG: hypothetical protein JW811_02180 [Clostridiales bacterium]|nr:hypothetical protein [Clostridiales bacterium]
MQCLLYALAPEAAVTQVKLAGTRFIIIETEPIDERGWSILSGHSGVSFAAVKDGDWLKPLQSHQSAYLSADLPQVLKYKGKTNVDFTLMMIHCAKAASAFALDGEPMTVADPLCGRGTTLFCALQEGGSAVGVEVNRKAVHEADTYFNRYLQYHRYKHKRETFSATLPEGGHAEEIRYRLANTPKAFKAGDTRSLRLFLGDAALADRMAGADSCHLIVSDLPYGVQHAARDKRGIAPLERLMEECFPAFCRTLKTGGATAVAFNTYTLKRDVVCAAMEHAGLKPMTEPPFNDFSHWVEQAVNRDAVIAVKA